MNGHTSNVRRSAPTSNAERQRRFRERNPGYYAALQARRRGSASRGAAPLIAAAMEPIRAEAAAATAAETAAAARVATPETPIAA